MPNFFRSIENSYISVDLNTRVRLCTYYSEHEEVPVPLFSTSSLPSLVLKPNLKLGDQKTVVLIATVAKLHTCTTPHNAVFKKRPFVHV